MGGPAFKIRELKPADIERGFLDALSNLSDLEGLSPGGAKKVLAKAMRNPGQHVLVALDGRSVLGTTTLLVEQKFIHGGGLVGHIEDVAVRPGDGGRGVGSSLVKAAVQLARELGCYKCILDCKEDLVPFYERMGFRRHEIGMRLDLRPKSP